MNADLAKSLEPGFDRIARCSKCRSVLQREMIFRRAFELSGGAWLLAILCAACNDAIPTGTPAERELRRELEREALSEIPTA